MSQDDTGRNRAENVTGDGSGTPAEPSPKQGNFQTDYGNRGGYQRRGSYQQGGYQRGNYDQQSYG